MNTNNKKRAKICKEPQPEGLKDIKPLALVYDLFTSSSMFTGIQIENIHTLLPLEPPRQSIRSRLTSMGVDNLNDWILNTFRTRDEELSHGIPMNTFDTTDEANTTNAHPGSRAAEETVQPAAPTPQEAQPRNETLATIYPPHIADFFNQTKDLVRNIFEFKQSKKVSSDTLTIKERTKIHELQIKIRSVDFECGRVEAILKADLSNNPFPLYTLLDISVIDLENNFFWNDFQDKKNIPTYERMHYRNPWAIFGELDPDLQDNLYILSQLFYNEDKYIEYKRKIQKSLQEKHVVFMKWKEIEIMSKHRDISIDGCYYMKYDLKRKYITGFYVHKNGFISQVVSLNKQEFGL